MNKKSIFQRDYKGIIPIFKGKKGICPKCKKFKNLTRHSISGNHIPPFELVCFKCHKKIHNQK